MRQERMNQLLEVAERHIQAGRPRRAVFAYRKTLAISTSIDWQWEFAQLRLAEIHLARGQTELAFAHLLKANERCSNEPRYAYLLGHILRRLGQPERAIPYLMTAVEAIRERTLALVELAYVTADLGDRETARLLVKSVRQIEPEHPEINAAWLYSLDS
ncbi:MAG: hypothetical protein VYA30_11975 [Myxococcota bacterium]|nr:hypothetical protein [Myxococcota bacterium]